MAWRRAPCGRLFEDLINNESDDSDSEGDVGDDDGKGNAWGWLGATDDDHDDGVKT